MPKLDIEFELTGLKLKIKGESDDVTGKVAELQRQVQELIGNITALAQNGAGGQLPVPPPVAAPQKFIEGTTATDTTAQRRRQSRKGGAGAPRARAEAIDFKLDDAKYGFPKQTWSTAQKASWLLYVLTEDNLSTEATASLISATFNKHYKTFGTITTSNVARDLAKEKGTSVNTDATKTPETWYLALKDGKNTVKFGNPDEQAPALDKIAIAPHVGATDLTLALALQKRSGPSTLRTWTLNLANLAPIPAVGGQLNLLSLVQVSGARACQPKVLTSLPISVGTIPKQDARSLEVPIDFSSCSDDAVFNVSIVYSADHGAAVGNAILTGFSQ
jgi:hypothetical protein